MNALGTLVDADRPRHLPVEALDFSTGYVIAAAAIRALTHRMTTGQGSVSRLSLPRTAATLTSEGTPRRKPRSGCGCPSTGGMRAVLSSAAMAAR
ncbi:CoA transferase [Streptomyces pharetrae]|uniref:CoA transferase n=1 Tax=Streptomyces pharetrae TaxID=291370 RepID=UPI00334F74B8